MIVRCHYCNKKSDFPSGKINRARKMGLNIYCNRKCSGLSRRSSMPLSEKKKLKSQYDKKYREINELKIKKRKHEYFKRTYNPQKASIARKKNMHKHIEYCRRPEYKKYKKQYDEKYRSKKIYGEFWESFLIIKKIENEYNQQEVRQINNLHNKSQKRKRKWKQLKKQNYLLPA